MFGRDRAESRRWVAFRSHYGFDAFYCRPGVEGEGGRFSRTHCVPMPVVDSIAELNELLDATDAKDDHRRIAIRSVPVVAGFVFERDLLRPLPSDPAVRTSRAATSPGGHRR